PVESLDSPNLNIRQFYNVDRVDASGRTNVISNAPVPPNNVGLKSMPNYDAVANAAITTGPNGSKFFAGQRDDPFFADLGPIFDLLSIRPGPPGNMGGGVDSLANYNVLSIVMQIPKSDLVGADSPIIGAWTTTSRMSAPVAEGAQPQW